MRRITPLGAQTSKLEIVDLGTLKVTWENN